MTVEQAINILQRMNKQDVIAIDWFEEVDIQNIAEDFDTQLTRTELLRVADDVENGDAEVGMNWDSIRFAIGQVVESREE